MSQQPIDDLPVRRTLLGVILAAAAAGMLCTMTACRTTEGLGEDIEELGEEIDEEAEETQYDDD